MLGLGRWQWTSAVESRVRHRCVLFSIWKCRTYTQNAPVCETISSAHTSSTDLRLDSPQTNFIKSLLSLTLHIIENKLFFVSLTVFWKFPFRAVYSHLFVCVCVWACYEIWDFWPVAQSHVKLKFWLKPHHFMNAIFLTYLT